MGRREIGLGGPYEEIVGLSRAVRVGCHVAVGGTAPIGPDGRTVGTGDAGAQAERCYEIIGDALAAAGAGPADVVRTRTFLVDTADHRAVIAARKAFFGEVRPVDTIVGVAGFVDPDWLVEIEVDAVIPASG